MVRRHSLAGLAALVGVVALLAGATRAEDKDKEKPAHEHDEHYSACAKACGICAMQCSSCQHHCAHLVRDGKKDHFRTMRLCQDCSLICGVSTNVTSNHGPLSVTLCEACAKACDECGAACEKFPDDKHMAACAKSCRDCAKECREMLKHLGT